MKMIGQFASLAILLFATFAGFTEAQDQVEGKKIYATYCAACHGDKGQGSQDLGAPNLSDKIWLFGSDKATIVEGLMNGRGGVMPTWHGRLDDTTIKALTLYVHSLGGDQAP